MPQVKSEPLVSVLTTCYNREKYIGYAIESVLQSTYQNWELIITDDCSKDSSANIAREYAQRDERIKVFVNVTNLGDYFNRNRAALYAKGKYLKYVDADDYIYPCGLELLVEFMEKFPEAGWGLCSLKQDPNRPFPFMLSPNEAFEYNYFGSGLFHKAPLSSIIKKEAFDFVGGFTGKQHMGDFELWHLLAMKFSVVLMPEGIVWYRNHEDQQMNANRTDPKIPFKYVSGALKFFEKENSIPLSKQQIKRIKQKLNEEMNKIIFRNLIKGNLKLSLSLYKLKRSDHFTLGNI